MVRSLVRFLSCITLVSMALVAMPVGGTGPSSAGDGPAFQHGHNASVWFAVSAHGAARLAGLPGGHLRGYYHTSYYKLFIPVVGGRDGDYIWLDIGPAASISDSAPDRKGSCTSWRR